MRGKWSGKLRSKSVWALVVVMALGMVACQGVVPTQPGAVPTSTPPPPGNGPGQSTATATTAPPNPGGGNGGQTPESTQPSGTQPSTPGTGTPTPSSGSAIPSFDHVYVIVFENKEAGEVIGSSHAPYLNSLANQYGLATNYTGVSHPSEPNYLALWSGSTFGITDDAIHDLPGASVADQITAHGKSWMVYAENYPVGSSCFTGSSSQGGEDGNGSYARKHNPAMSFMNVSTDNARCTSHVTDFTHFSAGAANFAFIVPNLCNDMHNCPVSTGDSWLQQWLPSHIFNTSTWQNSNSAIFITWDEGTTNNGGGGTVPLIVISHETHSGMTSSQAHDHYSVLRTVEEAWGLGCLRNSCGATDLSEFFTGNGK